jgi:gamma-glutamylaminecyclotransferase
MSATVFVYGTLKRGQSNHHWIAGQRYLGPAKTLESYALYDLGGYPGMIEMQEGESIHGELWLVDDTTLAQLDILEGVAEREYHRALVRLQPPNQDSGAITYLWLPPVDQGARIGPQWTSA